MWVHYAARALVAATGSDVLRGVWRSSHASKSARRITLGLVVDGEENGNSPLRQASSRQLTVRDPYIAATGSHISGGQDGRARM